MKGEQTMYDFYLNREENNYYKRDKTSNFKTIDGENVTEIFDLPAINQKSYYGKAKVITTEKARYLLSYDTIICRLSFGGEFRKLWDGWSATTAKHINDFMRFTRFGCGFNKKEWGNLDYFPDTGVIYTYSDFNKIV